MPDVDFSVLVGEVLRSVEREEDELTFVTESGTSYSMHHNQDCCEDVHIEDICGNLQDLVGSPILLARKDTNYPTGDVVSSSEEWTFYNIATEKGHVTIRWVGDLETYYSVKVGFWRD